jgi:hypothetical protein
LNAFLSCAAVSWPSVADWSSPTLLAQSVSTCSVCSAEKGAHASPS